MNKHEEQGFTDYVNGKTKAQNRYRETGDQEKQSAWLRGWMKAERLRNR